MTRQNRGLTLQILVIATLLAVGLLLLSETRRADGYHIDSGSAGPRSDRTAVTDSVGLSPELGTNPKQVGRGLTASGITLMSGVLSYVGAKYGPEYLALPFPRGTVATICAVKCVTRRSTDYGPDQRVHPNRIADLSAADFVYVCGVPLSAGLCKGTVELEPPVDPKDDEMRDEVRDPLPATDTAP